MTTRNIRTLHVRIYGKVQGVFFRDHTRHTAEILGISGWVKNLRDGSVEALISGEDKQINKMLQWFHQGSPSSAVREVVVDEDARSPENNQFLIQR